MELDSEIAINNLCERHLLEPQKVSYEAVLSNIEELVRFYMNNNFLALVQLLYRVDVNEKHITDIALNHILDSDVIAQLILNRIIEKLQFKKENTLPKIDLETSEEEKW